jgi:hypothetical protein
MHYGRAQHTLPKGDLAVSTDASRRLLRLLLLLPRRCSSAGAGSAGACPKIGGRGALMLGDEVACQQDHTADEAAGPTSLQSEPRDAGSRGHECQLAISHQPSAISHQPSAISQQPAASSH